MKVILTGATGFTGSHLLAQLLARDIRPICFVRSTSAPLQEGVPTIVGDLADPRFPEADVLLNTASIGFGQGPAIVAAAQRAGIRRAIFISTTAIFTTLNAKTKSVRMAAEEAIRNSGLQWTIIRPTMIYGTARDRNMVRLIRWLSRWPVMPVGGGGTHLLQPVHVDDVARAMLLALDREVSIGRAYNVAGKAPLTFNQVIDVVAAQLGKRVFKLHLPVTPIASMLALAESAKIRLPIKAEQIRRLDENKAFDYSDAARDLGYAPMAFDEGIAREIESLGLRRK
jgi:nucleoside-diphosphate-sugar epimerase